MGVSTVCVHLLILSAQSMWQRWHEALAVTVDLQLKRSYCTLSDDNRHGPVQSSAVERSRVVQPPLNSITNQLWITLVNVVANFVCHVAPGDAVASNRESFV